MNIRWRLRDLARCRRFPGNVPLSKEATVVSDADEQPTTHTNIDIAD